MKFRKRAIPDDAKRVICWDFEARNNNCGLFEYCGNRKEPDCDGTFYKCIDCPKEYIEEEEAMICCYDKKHPE